MLLTTIAYIIDDTGMLSIIKSKLTNEYHKGISEAPHALPCQAFISGIGNHCWSEWYTAEN